MANIHELEACWTQRMADFDKRLAAASTPSNPTLLQLADEFKAFREIVHNMLNILHQQSHECTKVIDALDMRQRQKVLLFNGISEDISTDVLLRVLSLIHDKLGLSHVSNDFIKRCHRIGVKNSELCRPVLVHFRNHDTKAEVWRSKAKLKGSGFVITEFLTKIRQAIHKRARQYFGMKNVWTLDGVIHIKPPGAGHEKIVCEQDLDQLIFKYPESVLASESLATSSGAQQSGVRHQDTRRKPTITVVPGEDLKRSRRMISKK